MSEVLVEIRVYEDDFSQWDKEMAQTLVVQAENRDLEGVLSELVNKALDLEKEE